MYDSIFFFFFLKYKYDFDIGSLDSFIQVVLLSRYIVVSFIRFDGKYGFGIDRLNIFLHQSK